MALFEFSEIEERTAMKQLFEYIYSRALGDSGNVDHRHESSWEQVCRFLCHFDPEGQTQRGYNPKKKLSEIWGYIDRSDLESLPCIETYLDVALTLNDFLCGIGVDDFHEPFSFDPILEPHLKSLGLINKDGTASDPLRIDALNSFQFFDPEKRELVVGAREFLDQVAEAAWRSASTDDKNFLLSTFQPKAKPSVDVSNWFGSRWRFGEWLNNGEWEKDGHLFRAHPAIGWFLARSIKKALEEGRIHPD